jgi:hypothetical protein
LPCTVRACCGALRTSWSCDRPFSSRAIIPILSKTLAYQCRLSQRAASGCYITIQLLALGKKKRKK